MPVSVIDRGVPSTPTLKVPGILPLTVGVKLTRMLQLVNAGSEAGQLLVCVKTDEPVPVMVIEEIVSAAKPEFVR